MSENDRTRWNVRYRERPGDLEPSPLLTDHVHLAPFGRALDIACGNGRNSLFLADRGFLVDAVDISDVATAPLRGRHPNLRVLCLDLDTWTFPPESYDLIVNIRFLDRRLFALILAGLRPGGLLVFEAFQGSADDPYTLAPGELRRAFGGLDILLYRESPPDPPERPRGTAAMAARRPAASASQPPGQGLLSRSTLSTRRFP
jgi:SAM-dependent methyltransferase